MIYTGADFRRLRIEREKSQKRKREAFYKKLVFSIFLIGSLFIISFVLPSYAGADNTSMIEYRVDHGDNLWKIASQYKGQDMDTREFIYIIKKANKLSDSQINAGQLLKIPIK